MIRILIADDHALVRRGLMEILLREMKNMECGEAENVEQTLTQVRNHDWELVILDIGMPGRSGIDILGDLKRIRPKLPVLVLSAYPEDQYGKRVLRAGAAGYLHKSAAPEELNKAIRKVLAGGRYVSSMLAEKLAIELSTGPDQSPHAKLSDRELEVLRMIAAGKTVSQIADQLHLSDKTISTYRARVLEKMEMTTNAELMQYAIRNHLVE